MATNEKKRRKTEKLPVKAAWDLFHQRASRVLKSSFEHAGPRAIKAALAAPTDAGAVLRIIEATAPTAADLEPLGQAIIRGHKVKKDLLKKAGGTLPTKFVQEKLGITKQAISKAVKEGRLLAVPISNKEFGFPAIQFSDAGIVPGIRDVLSALSIDNAWTKLSFLLSQDPALSDKSPIEILKKGQADAKEKVVRLARAYAAN